jgi:uncharacterized integral membrane protein (TIGR00698 family)
MTDPAQGIRALYKQEDWWAVWLGLGIVVVAIVMFFADSTLKPLAISPTKNWTQWATVVEHFAKSWPWYLLLYVVFGAIFTISTAIMGQKVGHYIPGFTIIYVASVLILIASNNKYLHEYNLEAPVLALLLGLLVGNFVRLPRAFDTALRTEYYIKTGIVLLGATLPLTLIYTAGPVAFVQATIVSLATWLTIYFAATRIFKLDKQFGAVLGAGGAVCGVSASIAVGGAVKAHKEHVAIGISVVTIWALVMIFVLPILSKAMGLHPGVAGAWIGTSEFADAAGFAAAQTIASAAENEGAIHTFTLMKVIGRDIWVGIWAFVLSIISVTMWERRSGNAGDLGQRASAVIIWERFPKFVIGFFVASVVMSFVAARYTSEEEYEKVLQPMLVAPIKTLRTWTFVFTFLCIGLTTRFRELTKFGLPPLWAFTIGVAVNVPLGYFLSTVVFHSYWSSIGG